MDTGLPRADVERWLAAARYQPRIVAAMDRPLLEPPKWYQYIPSFIAADRVESGLRFWRENAALLARAEETYGVPAEIIVAIIGIETYYGRNVGSYRVIDALATLAFDYPRRAPFFRGELKEYLLLAHDQGISPLVPKGSFAGAMGMPQFMPGSYRRFAIDFDSDGHTDLWRSHADVIGSVANYFVRHDWQPGQPVLLPAIVAPGAPGCGAAPAGWGHQRAPAPGGVGGRRRHPGTRTREPQRRPRRRAAARGECGAGRGGREPVGRLPELLRDHPVQQEPPVRGGGLDARGAPARGALTPDGPECPGAG